MCSASTNHDKKDMGEGMCKFQFRKSDKFPEAWADVLDQRVRRTSRERTWRLGCATFDMERPQL
jgi:hypothetical protein